MKCEYKIIDNFLSVDLAQKIENTLMGDDVIFPWFYNKNIL